MFINFIGLVKECSILSLLPGCSNNSLIVVSISFHKKLGLHLAHNKCYRIYPKYSDTSTPYHIRSKIWTSTIHYPMLCLKIAGWVANSVDPDETPRSATSHLGLNCLLRPVCLNTYGKYGKTDFNILGSLHAILAKFPNAKVELERSKWNLV